MDDSVHLIEPQPGALMHKTVYRFGNFELDPKYRELRRDGEQVSLPLKSFDCLVYLVEHRDRAVGRDELISAVWSITELNDNTLAQALWRVRQVLDDTGSGERTTIRTVPRFGYCWIAPTEQVEVDIDPETTAILPETTATAPPEQDALPETMPGASQPHGNDTKPAQQPRPSSRWRIPAIAIAIATLVLALWLASHYSLRPADRQDEHRPDDQAEVVPSAEEVYLVLPVVLHEDDPEMAWIRLGIMDYVAAALRRSAEKHVLPSDQAVSLTTGMAADSPANERALQRLVTITGATHIVHSQVTRTDQGWHLVLDLQHGGISRSYQGIAAAPLQAAGIAVRSMLDDPAMAGDVQLPPRALLAAGHLREVAELIARFDPEPYDANRSDSEFAVLRLALLMQKGEFSVAAAQAEAVVDRIANSTDYFAQTLLSDALWLAVDAALRAGRLDLAERLAARLNDLPPIDRDNRRSVIQEIVHAELAHARGAANADERYAAALAAAEQRGETHLLIGAASAWLRHSLINGDLERAASSAGRLAVYADQDFLAARAVLAFTQATETEEQIAQARAKVLALAGERDPTLPF